MSDTKKTEIITISDSEVDENETEYSTPKRKADFFPFISVKRIRPIRTDLFKDFKKYEVDMDKCTSHHHNIHNQQESNSKESGQNEELEKVVREKVALQKELDESKKKVEKQEMENSLLYQKLSNANRIIESQKSLILTLQKDVEDNKIKAVKWESKFIKLKETMLEVNSSLGDLIESCMKDGSSPQLSDLDLNKKENSPKSNAPCTSIILFRPNRKSGGRNSTADSKTANGVKDVTITNCGSTAKSKATLMTRQRNGRFTGPQATLEKKRMKISKIVTNEPAQADKDVGQQEPLNFPGVKDEDCVKMETYEKRVLPKRARKAPLRFEHEFNTDFSITQARPKKEKIRIPLWPVSKLHGIGDCRNGFICVCGREFKSKKDLWSHIKPHIQGHRFSCFICGAGFNEMDEAHRHVQEVHKRR